MVKKSKRRGGVTAVAAVLVVVFVAAFALFKYLETEKGKIFLLDLGFKQRYAGVQQGLGRSIEGALASAGVEGGRIERGRGGDSGTPGSVEVIKVRVAPGASLIRINGLVDGAVREAGGRVRSCYERDGGRSIVMEIGTRNTTTHRCIVTKERGAAQADRAGKGIPKIALIVDDFGYFNNSLVREFLSLEAPLGISVIPGLKFSRTVCEDALNKGKEVLCHLPMEPEEGADDAGDIPLVRVSMNGSEIKEVMEKALRTTPGVVGMNNHMGSKATADKRVMETVLKVCRSKGLYFIDSMTTPNSVVTETAEKLGIRTLRNDLIIDNRADEIRDNMLKLISIAERRGTAIGILHVRRKTLEHLRWMIEISRSRGFRLVTVTEMIESDILAKTEGGQS